MAAPAEEARLTTSLGSVQARRRAGPGQADPVAGQQEQAAALQRTTPSGRRMVGAPDLWPHAAFCAAGASSCAQEGVLVAGSSVDV
jgi:hypothetical protein